MMWLKHNTYLWYTWLKHIAWCQEKMTWLKRVIYDVVEAICTRGADVGSLKEEALR